MPASTQTAEMARSILPEPLAAFGDLLTVEGMARLFDTSTRTIYRLCDKEELSYRKIGRRLYFPKHELIVFLDLEEYCIA